MRHYYTEGERAVLCIVAGEVKHHGICELSIDEIADLTELVGTDRPVRIAARGVTHARIGYTTTCRAPPSTKNQV
jgi:hypothetical protein